jgi:hypothetical protein
MSYRFVSVLFLFVAIIAFVLGIFDVPINHLALIGLAFFAGAVLIWFLESFPTRT